MRIFLKVILFPLEIVVVALIWLYKLLISPLLPRMCRFYPTCSKYMLLAIKEWGLIKGVWLGVKRIFRCRPSGECGEDFVPLNIKGVLKWTY